MSGQTAQIMFWNYIVEIQAGVFNEVQKLFEWNL